MRIAVLVNPCDHRFRSLLMGHLRLSAWRYQLDAIIAVLRHRGHRVVYADPTMPFRPADAAILHPDITETPADLRALADRYPVCINGGIASIAKHAISRNLVRRGDGWAGPVIVKNDYNCNGWAERRLNRIARRAGRPPPYPDLPRPAPYRVHPSAAAVPAGVWAERRLVVERFLPERMGEDHVLRIWSFLGRYERCSWYRAPDAVVKGAGVVAWGPAEVPADIRRDRARLGFDYGKFDFALGPDGPVLFDVNRTPAFLLSRPGLMRGEAPAMATALVALIADRQAGRG